MYERYTFLLVIRLEYSLINMQIKSCKFGNLKDHLIGQNSHMDSTPCIEGKGCYMKIHLEMVVQMCRVQTTWAQIKKLQREGTAVQP